MSCGRETHRVASGAKGFTSERAIFHFLALFFAFSLIPCALAQRSSSREAISIEDLAKLDAVTTGLTTADQVCARFAAGSVASAPAELKSQNGVLELSLNFKSATDPQGLVRYCYVTNRGLEAPTLRVSTPTLAFLSLLIFPSRLRRARTLLLMAPVTVAATVTSCGGNASQTDPGSTKSTYMVFVAGTAGTGSTQFQATVNVPITLQ